MTVAMLVAWTALALAVTLTPGPDTLLVAGSAVRRGAPAGLAATAGTVAGGGVYAVLCGFGFLSLLTAVPTLYGLVKLAGAAYLAFIGLTMLREAWRPAPAEAPADAAPVRAGGLAGYFRRGLITNALNPKIALFYLAVLPQFTGRGPDAPLLGVMLIAIHYLIGGLWLSVVALSAGRAGAAFKGGAASRWLHGTIGVFLLGLAGRLALERR